MKHKNTAKQVIHIMHYITCVA